MDSFILPDPLLPPEDPSDFETHRHEDNEGYSIDVQFTESTSDLDDSFDPLYDEELFERNKELLIAELIDTYKDKLSRRAKHRRRNGCCIIINDRQRSMMGCLPISLYRGSWIWLGFLFLLGGGLLAQGYTDFTQTMWKGVVQIGMAVLYMIQLIQMMLLVRQGVDALGGKNARKAVYLAAMNINCLALLVVSNLAMIVLQTYQGITEEISNPSLFYTILGARFLQIPFVMTSFLLMAGTFKSLACIWELGGTGKEMMSWPQIDQELGRSRSGLPSPITPLVGQKYTKRISMMAQSKLGSQLWTEELYGTQKF